MRAALYHGVGDIRLTDIPEPQPGPGQVKIAVAYNGICGSDLHEYYHAATFIPLEPHPLTGVHAPCVLGHEFSGTVTEIGAGVTEVTRGDRVAVRPTYSCGRCPACQTGAPNICAQLAFHGGSGPGGGLSQFTVVDESMVHRLPDSVSLAAGALVEPMAVAQHAVNRAAPDADDTVVIVGAGAIGIGLWFALTARGVTSIVVSEPSPQRRAGIAALGATRVIDPRTADLAQVVHEASSGRGAAVVFDAAGVSAAFTAALSVLAPRGTLMVVGVHERGFDFNPSTLLLGEFTVTASMTYSDEEFAQVIDAMARGEHRVQGSWLQTLPLDRLLDGFASLRSGDAVKILIEM